MVRKEKVNELIYVKVADILNKVLQNYGFIYQKSKHLFLRKVNGFNQGIRLSPARTDFNYDDTIEQMMLNFRLSTQISIPSFNKWFFEKTNTEYASYFPINSLSCQLELSVDDFESSDKYTPAPAQVFKSYVSFLLSDSSPMKEEIIQIEELIQNKLPSLIAELSEKSDILQLQKSQEHPSIALYVYGGFMELANEEIEKEYQNHINQIDEAMAFSDSEPSSKIMDLDRFISFADLIAKKTLLNPYWKKGISLEILDTKDQKIDFSHGFTFAEILRLDVSRTNIDLRHIFPNGDILMIVNSSKVVKINSKAELIFEKELKPKKGFENLYWAPTSGIIKESDEFYIDNYILTKDNKLIELSISDIKFKNPKSLPVIKCVTYWLKKEKYVALYENLFLIFNKDGTLEKKLELAETNVKQVIAEKEWILAQDKDSNNKILNFQGELIETYEYANANDSYAFSDNYGYLLSFGYSTKSQLYNLNDGKKETLWAHPTFIKDYKEALYNGVPHNFGMSIAKFSPDTAYIVGGAFHGKYVAWTLPHLERIELIPQSEVIEQIPNSEIVHLEGKTYLKNRAHNMTDIVFFDKGDLFLTEIRAQNLWIVWDSHFNNIGYKNFNSPINFHSSGYASQRIKMELIIYKRDQKENLISE